MPSKFPTSRLKLLYFAVKLPKWHRGQEQQYGFPHLATGWQQKKRTFERISMNGEQTGPVKR